MGSADVWGAVGTWLIGLLALVIAGLQYIGAIFWPKYFVRIGPTKPGGELRRIVVEITNRGGAAGMVHSISVVPTGHKFNIRASYGTWGSRPPFPFMLSGHATAVVVIDLEEKFRPNFRVLVIDAHKERCLRFDHSGSLLKSDQTYLPAGSLALREPPPEDRQAPVTLSRLRAGARTRRRRLPGRTRPR